VSVSPRFTLVGGSLFSFAFGGGGSRGGRRGRGKGGLLKRAAGFLAMGVRHLNGKDLHRGKITGREKGRSFDEFRDSRPDLFVDQDAELEDVDQGADEGQDVDRDEALANYRARTGGSPGGACPCGGIGRHAQGCEVWQ